MFKITKFCCCLGLVLGFFGTEVFAQKNIDSIPVETSAPVDQENWFQSLWRRFVSRDKVVSPAIISDPLPGFVTKNPKTDAPLVLVPPISSFPVALPRATTSIDMEQKNVAGATRSSTDVFDSVTMDTDGDLVLDGQDLCPNVPGEADGCPSFEPFVSALSAKNITIKQSNPALYRLEEFDQIRIGDSFELQVVDPVSGRVIVTSAPYKVTQ
jgi:hypothetical protein